MTDLEELQTIRTEIRRLAAKHPAQLRRAMTMLSMMSPKLATILKGWLNQ